MLLGAFIMAKDIGLKLLDTIPQIKDKINKALAGMINKVIIKNREILTKELRALVKQWVSEQPEMVELSKSGPGTLSSELGLVAGTEAIITDKIIQNIVSSVDIEITTVSSNLKKGGITFHCQPSDFMGLLNMPEGFVRTKVAAKLPWLRWLLLEGYKPIIVGYSYEMSPGKGRSKGGVMEEGGSWRVPPAHAGTADNNFITRAFASRSKEIQKLVQKHFR
jgi:hypothetical protein